MKILLYYHLLLITAWLLGATNGNQATNNDAHLKLCCDYANVTYISGYDSG